MGRGWGERGGGVGDLHRAAGASGVQEQSLEGLGAKLVGLGSRAGGVGEQSCQCLGAELVGLESGTGRVGKRVW